MLKHYRLVVGGNFQHIRSGASFPKLYQNVSLEGFCFSILCFTVAKCCSRANYGNRCDQGSDRI